MEWWLPPHYSAYPSRIGAIISLLWLRKSLGVSCLSKVLDASRIYKQFKLKLNLFDFANFHFLFAVLVFCCSCKCVRKHVLKFWQNVFTKCFYCVDQFFYANCKHILYKIGTYDCVLENACCMPLVQVFGQ